MLDQAPFPADWALSRLIDDPQASIPRLLNAEEEEVLRQHRQAMRWRTADELITSNAQFLYDMEGYQCVPIIYRRLLHHTKIIATIVSDLVKATSSLGISMWAEAARLLVDYSVSILSSRNLGTEKFLHSQRESIYWILDDAMLGLCLDQWEDDAKRERWDGAVKPITLALGEAMKKLQGWLDEHLVEMKRFYFEIAHAFPERLTAGYFKRSQEFLQESARVFEIERTVRLSRIGMLLMFRLCMELR
jgi:hypothetical protein